METQGKGTVTAAKAVERQGKGTVTAAKAVERQGKGTVSAAKAVERQGKGSVSRESASIRASGVARLDPDGVVDLRGPKRKYGTPVSAW